MTLLSLKTELDVAALLLAEGWLPEEINGILVFPLPEVIFHCLDGENHQFVSHDVIKVTAATPTTIYRARQLLQSAGWFDRQLDSLLKPCLYGRNFKGTYPFEPMGYRWQGQRTLSPHRVYRDSPMPVGYLGRYRCLMAFKRVMSLALVIFLVGSIIILA